MTQPDRIQALIDDWIATDPDGVTRNLRGGVRFPGGLPALQAERSVVPEHLLCPSCERNPISRNGRCEECQWAVS
jgi:hypothetical protein